MRFIAVRRFSEMTTVAAVGAGPGMALGARPVTARKKRKRKVEGVRVAYRRVRGS